MEVTNPLMGLTQHLSALKYVGKKFAIAAEFYPPVRSPSPLLPYKVIKAPFLDEFSTVLSHHSSVIGAAMSEKREMHEH